jgi:hypothetical protein
LRFQHTGKSTACDQLISILEARGRRAATLALGDPVPLRLFGKEFHTESTEDQISRTRSKTARI